MKRIFEGKVRDVAIAVDAGNATLSDLLSALSDAQRDDAWQDLKDAIEVDDQDEIDSIIVSLTNSPELDELMSFDDPGDFDEIRTGLLELQWEDEKIPEWVIDYVLAKNDSDLLYIVARSNISSQQAIRLSASMGALKALADNRRSIREYYREFLSRSTDPDDWNCVVTCAQYAAPDIVLDIIRMASGKGDEIIDVVLPAYFLDVDESNVTNILWSEDFSQDILLGIVRLLPILDNPDFVHLLLSTSQIGLNDPIFANVNLAPIIQHLIVVYKSEVPTVDSLGFACWLANSCSPDPNLRRSFSEKTGYDSIESYEEALDASRMLSGNVFEQLIFYIIEALKMGLK